MAATDDEQVPQLERVGHLDRLRAHSWARWRVDVPCQAKVFVLCINLKFQTVPDRDEFLEIWRPLGAYVQVNEEGTLSYECLVADTDELLVLVFER